MIKVSSSRGDYVLLNLQQVVWATVDTGETGGASRITLHMTDGVAFQLRGNEAEYAFEALRAKLGEPPDNPELPG